MAQIPVFLINLDSASHRLRYMTEQLDALKIGFERFSAVVGKDLTEEERSQIAPEASWIGKRPPNPGEVGCFLSHMNVLSTIETRAILRACILEDDVRLSSDFRNYLDDEAALPADADIVKLELAGPPEKLRYIDVGHFAGRRLVFFPEGGWPGTAAYIVTRLGARKLLHDMKRMINMYDWQAFDYARNGVMVYHVLPLPAYQTEASEMGRPAKAPRASIFALSTLQQKVTKRLRRARRTRQRLAFLQRKFGLAAIVLPQKSVRREQLIKV